MPGFLNPSLPVGQVSHMPRFGEPVPNAGGHTIGVYLYTATGAETGGNFTVTHSLGLTPPYYVTCSPQGAHAVPTIDPNPASGVQTLNDMTVVCSGPLTAGDKFLFVFYSVPA